MPARATSGPSSVHKRSSSSSTCSPRRCISGRCARSIEWRPAHRGRFGSWFSLQTADPGDSGRFRRHGATDVAIYRVGNWFIRNHSTVPFGLAGDVPVPGDYDGNGIVETAVFRPSSAEWLFPAAPPVQFGSTGDIPVPGDYNGDGITDIAVWRSTGTGPAQWFVRNQITVAHGARGDIPVVGDWDRDGRDDMGIFEPDTGMWRTSAPAAASSFHHAAVGTAADLLVNADSTQTRRLRRLPQRIWLILRSGTNYTAPESIPFGVTGDTPIADGQRRWRVGADRVPAVGRHVRQTLTGTPVLNTGEELLRPDEPQIRSPCSTQPGIFQTQRPQIAQCASRLRRRPPHRPYDPPAVYWPVVPSLPTGSHSVARQWGERRCACSGRLRRTAR